MTPTIPHDAEAERAVLGACLLDRDAVVAIAPLLTPEQFYWPKHGDVYRAILGCYQRRVPPDIRTVTDALRLAGALDAVGGVEFLGGLLDDTPTAVHVEYYADIVTRHAEARAHIEAGGRIAAMAQRDLPPEELRAEAAALLAGAQLVRKQDGGFVAIGEVFDRQFNRITGGEALGTPTGYYDLDAILGGLAAGELTLLAGIPGSGKTAFAINALAWSWACLGRRVGVVSLEMTADELAQRITAVETGIDMQRQRSADFDPSDLARIVRMNGERERVTLFVEDHAPMTLDDMRARVLRLQAARGPLDLLVIDYLGLLSMDLKKQNTAQAMQAASQSIKNLAKELRCPVVLLTQLNRDIFKRADRRPTMADIREAGEAAANQVIVVMRDEQFDPNTERKGLADFYIIKNRSGRQGVATLAFDGPRATFRNLDRYREPTGY